MCIAILTTPGKVLDDDIFRKCFRSNKDGFGMAWVEPSGNVVQDKGWMVEQYALDAYKDRVNKGGNKHAMLLHFRLRTAGKIDPENCHPFRVKGGSMIHNGTFWQGQGVDGPSDSRILAERCYDQLRYENLTANKEHFDKAFGYNRVAFLFNEGKYVIFSERKDGGQWHDGIWFSNGGWKGHYGGRFGNGDNGNGSPTPLLANDLDVEDQEVYEMDRALWGQDTAAVRHRLGWGGDY